MGAIENEVISTSSIIRWIIGASAAIIMTGGSLWLNTVSKQMDRIEESLSLRMTKLEQTIDTIKVAEASAADKAMSKLIDLQIESKLHAMRLDQLERAAESRQPPTTKSPFLKKNAYEPQDSYKSSIVKEVLNNLHKG